MWLFKSSIGRKFVMAVTGVCLVLFVTFHVLMNSVALLWPAAYNSVCEFLGANWYALVASMGLAALFIIHIIYAVWLTLQNRAARGNDRYAVTARQPQVEWASKNMLVLGIVVVAFLVVHLIQFWSKMQLQELLGAEVAKLPTLDETPVAPAQGTLFLQMAFSQIWTPIVYIIGFVALWFHMTHGFWSMFHTAGWDNNTWLPRLKKISCWWTSIVVVLFVAQAVVFTVRAQNNYYTENEELQEQYSEFWTEQAKANVENFIGGLNAKVGDLVKDRESYMANQQTIMDIQQKYIIEEGPQFVETAKAIQNALQKHCSSVAPSQEVQQMQQMSAQIEQQIEMSKMVKPENK
jgi:succinate dehydrogenase / fumarate reductase cytochrome b subunit